jgi:hypothetical protein
MSNPHSLFNIRQGICKGAEVTLEQRSFKSKCNQLFYEHYALARPFNKRKPANFVSSRGLYCAQPTPSLLLGCCWTAALKSGWLPAACKHF